MKARIPSFFPLFSRTKKGLIIVAGKFQNGGRGGDFSPLSSHKLLFGMEVTSSFICHFPVNTGRLWDVFETSITYKRWLRDVFKAFCKLFMNNGISVRKLLRYCRTVLFESFFICTLFICILCTYSTDWKGKWKAI